MLIGARSMSQKNEKPQFNRNPNTLKSSPLEIPVAVVANCIRAVAFYLKFKLPFERGKKLNIQYVINQYQYPNQYCFCKSLDFVNLYDRYGE